MSTLTRRHATRQFNESTTIVALPDLHPIRTPDLGATSPVRVSAWLVEIGESVRAGDRLVELLLPGLTYDVPSPINGCLVEVRCAANTTVGPGEVLGCIREES